MAELDSKIALLMAMGDATEEEAARALDRNGGSLDRAMLQLYGNAKKAARHETVAKSGIISKHSNLHQHPKGDECHESSFGYTPVIPPSQPRTDVYEESGMKNLVNTARATAVSAQGIRFNSSCLRYQEGSFDDAIPKPPERTNMLENTTPADEESGMTNNPSEGSEEPDTGQHEENPPEATRPGAFHVGEVSSSYEESASIGNSSTGRTPFEVVAELVDEEEQERLYRASQELNQAQEQAQAAQRERDQAQLERDVLRARLESSRWNKWKQKCRDLSKKQRRVVYLILGGTLAVIVAGIVSATILLKSGEGSDSNQVEPPLPQAPFCLHVNFSCWVQLGIDIQGSQKGDRFGWPVSLAANGTRLAVSAWHNDLHGIDAGLVRVFDINNHKKASQLGSDIIGERPDDIARGLLSRDGNRLVVGSPRNDGIDGTKAWSGQVRVFELESGSWKQVGDSIYGEGEDDYSGRFPALSADGSILAIGAQWHNGMAGMYSGHVRVYRYVDSAWVRLGHDIEGAEADDEFGSTVVLSDDGMVVAVSAWYNDKIGADSGHVRVFRYESENWMQLGGDIVGKAAGDEFGVMIAISSDGKTLAAGAPYNDGNGVNSGHVRVFSYNESDYTWRQVGQDINGDKASDELSRLALSSNGKRVAASSFVAANDTGYVRVYDNINGTWQQVGGKIIGRRPHESFGADVSLSSDGNRLAVGGTSWAAEPPRNGAVRLYDFQSMV